MNEVEKKDSNVKKRSFNSKELKHELLSKVDILKRVAVLDDMGIDFIPSRNGNWLSVDEAEVSGRFAKKRLLNLGFMYSKLNKKWYYTTEIPRDRSHKSTYRKCVREILLS